MRSRLKKLKASLDQKAAICWKNNWGRSCLMDSIINNLTAYYGNSIRANAQNVGEMKNYMGCMGSYSQNREGIETLGSKGDEAFQIASRVSAGGCGTLAYPGAAEVPEESPLCSDVHASGTVGEYIDVQWGGSRHGPLHVESAVISSSRCGCL
ncbi:hypothetical protein NPIL_237681 [Nephila pilipes]|uniref:Uncharacterized protein n=1 Tax=Nephila pilipes TaxID=299642 RepID=A0A8X6NFD2_NEPPI|nr:hypothetical protein NPIL_237681 [Nephila pilipes]